MSEKEIQTVKDTKEDRSSLASVIGKAIGMDITTFAIPVTFNEPTTFLQRMMEFVQYSHLLDAANKHANEPEVALVYLTAFSMSNYATSERTQKPFNPLLGETFEYIDPDTDLKFIAEQVSHHPPIGASHMENKNFILEQFHAVKTKFLGNSLEVGPSGYTRITLKETGKVYAYEGIKTLVHNVIIGKVWIDMFGDVTLTEEGSKRKVELSFKPCGLFSKGWHECDAIVYNSEGVPVYQVYGKWNESIYAVKLDPSSQEKVSKSKKRIKYKNVKVDNDMTKTGHFAVGVPKLVWVHSIKNSTQHPYTKWDLTTFTQKLLSCPEDYAKTLPKTDSRLRADRLALERLDPKLAGVEKSKLEEAQRALKRQRSLSNVTYYPRYFEKATLPSGFTYYTYKKDVYWKEKEEKLRKLESGENDSSEDELKRHKSKREEERERRRSKGESTHHDHHHHHDHEKGSKKH